MTLTKAWKLSHIVTHLQRWTDLSLLLFLNSNSYWKFKNQLHSSVNKVRIFISNLRWTFWKFFWPSQNIWSFTNSTTFTTLCCTFWSTLTLSIIKIHAKDLRVTQYCFVWLANNNHGTSFHCKKKCDQSTSFTTCQEGIKIPFL